MTTPSQADINTLIKYTETLERKFDQFMSLTQDMYKVHISNIEAKLDQLVEITRTVAQLQVQQSTHTSEMIEIKASMRDFIQANKATYDRLHDRLDKVQAEIQVKEIKHLDLIAAVSGRLNKWVNRVIGGFLVAGVLVGSLQWFIVEYFDRINTSILTTQTAVASIQQSLVEFKADARTSSIPSK